MELRTAQQLQWSFLSPVLKEPKLHLLEMSKTSGLGVVSRRMLVDLN